MSLLNLKDFLAWVRERPAHEVYNYSDLWHCPIAKFVRDQNFIHVMVETNRIIATDVAGLRHYEPIPKILDDTISNRLNNMFLGRKGWTYGELQQRLEELA